ncbi:AI-2E family transporter [Pseudomonadota bacterium]
MSKNIFVKWYKSAKERVEEVKSRMKEIKEEKKIEFAEARVTSGANKGRMTLELSPANIAKTAATILIVLLLFYFLFEIRGILLIFFIAFLLAAALDPLVDKLQENKVPRSISVLSIYILAFLLLGVFATKVFGLLLDQTVEIVGSLEGFVTHIKENGGTFPFSEQIGPFINETINAVDVQTVAANYREAFNIVSNQLLSISIGLFNLLIVLVLTFFITVEEESIDDFMLSLFPKKYGKYIITRMTAIKDQIGLWLRGQLMVSIVAAIISYIGLAALGVDYALTLSIIAGFSMVIPVIGRGVAWLLTLPIVLNQDPWLALWMSVYYLAIQQVENNFLVPYIMNKAVGLSPIIIIFAMMVGGHYLGVLGLILSIPIATTVAIFVRDFVARKK